MTTQTMSADELREWTANQTAGTCRDCGAKCEKSALRCAACHLALRKSLSDKRHAGDGIQNKRGAMVLSVKRGEPVPVLEPGGHAHRFALPESPDERGVYLGVCACGETKEHYPWGWNVLPGDGRKSGKKWNEGIGE